jgi:ComF family protein
MAGLLLPSACEACGRAAAGEQWLCAPCAEALARIERAPACPCCAYALALWGDPCPRCLGRGQRRLGAILRLGRYESPLRELILAMKYRKRWALAADLADRLLRRPGVEELIGDADALVPVPLHPWRHWQRGFNQSEQLCRRLSQRTGKPVWSGLRRLRLGERQASLRSAAASVRNVKEAYQLKGSPKGARLLLVDDVLTTGATLRASARVLHAGGARALSALVLAVADPADRSFDAS